MRAARPARFPRALVPRGGRPLTRAGLRIQIAPMPLNYEIRVRGRVGEQLADSLGLAAEVEPVETVLRGPVQGQADLHEILAQLQEMGLELLEIRQLPPDRQG
jgi:hypothetical protein